MQAPNESSFKRVFTAILLAGIIGYFLYLMIPWLNNDLWNDEIYTLEKFTLVHFKTTLTDYHVPNNHILYNIFDHFYLKLVGIKTLRQAMEHVWVLRLPLLLLSIIILLLQYKTGALVGGKMAGLLAAAILACNLPFQNFCLQVRGYPFSMFFDLLLIYNALMYTIYHRRGNLFWIIICSWATVYTIPSNLYCVFGVIAFFGIEWLRKTAKQRAFDTGNFAPALAVVAGIAIALVCYSPVLKHVFSNEYVRSVSTAAPPGQSVKVLQVFYDEIIAGHVLLYLLFAVCSVLFFVLPLSPGETQTAKTWKLILWQFITPVIVVAIHGEHPPDRVFVYLAPFLTLLIGITLAYVIRLMPGRRLQWPVVTGLLAYLVVACQLERQWVTDLMNENLRTEQRTQGLHENYYSHNFHPLRLVQYLEKNDGKDSIPVIYKISEPHDVPEYLEAFGIPNHPADSLDYFLKADKRVYVITLFPHEYREGDFLAKRHATIKEVLPPAYHHLLEISTP